MTAKKSSSAPMVTPPGYVDPLGGAAYSDPLAGPSSLEPAATAAPAPASAEPDAVMPFRLNGVMITVPAKSANLALRSGAVPVGEEEWNAHLAEVQKQKDEQAFQEQYGDLSHQLEAGAASAVESVPFAGAGALSLLPKGAKESVRNSIKANPVSSGIGMGLGTLAQIAATSGLGGIGAAARGGVLAADLAEGAEAAGTVAKLAEGADLAGHAGKAAELAKVAEAATPAVEEAAAQGASAARGAQLTSPTVGQRLTQIATAPQEAITKVGQTVQQGIQRLLPTQIDGMAGKLAEKAINVAAMAGQGAAEGAAYGASDYLNEQALSADPEFDGQKLVGAMGGGALFGGATGGLLGASEEAVRGVASLLPTAEKASGQLAMRALKGGTGNAKILKTIEGIPGGEQELGNFLMKEGYIKPGQSVTEILPQLKAGEEAAGAKIGQILDNATTLGGPGVSAKQVIGAFDQEIENLQKNWIGDPGLVTTIKGYRDGLLRKMGLDEASLSKLVPPIDEAEIRSASAKKYLDSVGYKAEHLDESVAHAAYEEERAAGKAHNPDVAEAHARNAEAKAAEEAERARLPKSPDVEELKRVQEEAVAKAEASRAKAVAEVQNKALEEAQSARASAVQVAEDKRITYKDLANVRRDLDKEVDWGRSTDAMINKKQESIKRIRSELEKHLESGMDEAGKTLTQKGLHADLGSQYENAKIEYRRLKAAAALADKAAMAKNKNATLGMSAMLGGVAASHIAAGPAGIATGLAGALATKMVKERGASTAAYLADKVATLTAIQRASGKVEQKMARGVEAVAAGEKFAAKAPEHGLTTFADKAEAVLSAEKNPQGHTDRIARILSGVAEHAPQTAEAFRSSAVKMSAYLSSVLPRPKPANPMQPNGPTIQPSKHEQYVFGKQFDALHHPATVLEDISKGTWIPEQFTALQNGGQDKTAVKMAQMLTKTLERETKPVGMKILLPVSLLTGAKPPILDAVNVHMFQANMGAVKQNGAQPGQAGGKPKTGGSGHATPKAGRMAIAENTSLSPMKLT